MTKSPTVRSVDQDLPSGREPAPLLLDGEQLCWCEHLDGDHLIGEGRCTECGCAGFRLDNLEAL